MKTSLRNTLRNARSLQAQYTAMNAPATQNVRNPLPLWQLIQVVLPVMPDPNSALPVVKEIKFTVDGKEFVQRQNGFEIVKNLMPKSHFKTHGKTAREIADDLVEMGYLVNYGSVHQSLCNLRSAGIISAVAGDKTNNGKGRRPMKYFATK